jgi:hypothetical protein
MPSANDRAPVSEVLGRAWSAWERFWFTPTDPTPLCLMRIVVGLLVLYVHVAYTFDLHALVGPNGWYDHAQANRERHEWPVFAPPATWELPVRFRMPPVAEQRRALRVFIDSVAQLDREKQTKVLNLLRFYLPRDLKLRDEVLNYLKYLPPDFPEREEELRRMERYGTDAAKAEEKEGRKSDREVPAALIGLSPKDREQFKHDAHAFLDMMPDDRTQRDMIFDLFRMEGTSDLSVLVNLIDPDGPPNRRPKLPSDPAERAKYLDYCERWTCPPDDPDVVVRGHVYYSPFFHITDPRAINLMHGLHLLVILLFTVGLFTRVTGVLTWLAALAYIQRNPLALFGQDTMMNLCLVYLILSPCGEIWSVDWLIARFRAGQAALRRGESPTETGPRKLVSAGFALRLLQVQYCFMYMSAGLAKLKGESWWNGTATWLTMTNPEFSPLHIDWFRKFLVWLCQDGNRPLWELYMNATVAFTLLLEIGFPFLVWTRLRPVMVAGAILLHFGIAMNMGLIVFSLFMFALLLAWMPPEAVRRVFARPPSRLVPLQLRYDSHDPKQVKSAAVAYALDVWGQVQFADARREAPTAHEDADSGYHLTTTLAMTQPFAWLLRLPGLSYLGRMAFGDTVTVVPATGRDESARKRPGHKPVASR